MPRGPAACAPARVFRRVPGPVLRPVRPLALLLALLTLAVAACGGDANGPSGQVLTGTWSGNFTAGSTPATLTMTITESSGSVSGNGSLAAGQTSLPVNITGAFSSPNTTLTLSADGFSSATLTGTVTGTQLTATLNGSGFANTPVTLSRQGT